MVEYKVGDEVLVIDDGKASRVGCGVVTRVGEGFVTVRTTLWGYGEQSPCEQTFVIPNEISEYEYGCSPKYYLNQDGYPISILTDEYYKLEGIVNGE